MHKYWRLIIAAVVLVTLFLVCAVISGPRNNHQAVIDGHVFKVDFADTLAEQERGLGGRLNLTADQGMLFRFTRPNKTCFWMKDMRFSLDIIWFGGDKKVNHIAQNVVPETYPSTFCPDQDAQYVLEVNAGTISRLGIKAGDSISF